jgi:glycosyltransferase involved in cell wall biosynthesis
VISVVIPAFNEEDGIVPTVSEFLTIDLVSEVIVVDNNSTDKTRENAVAAGARVIAEPNQGYGAAILTGIQNANQPVILLCEADYSFYASDLDLLLPYLKFFDMVKGARSVDILISEDADYGFLLRWGNFAVAKFQELLYFGARIPGKPGFREMGGTFRVFTRDSYEVIHPLITETKSAFLADLTSLYLRNGLSVLELPIRYRSRIGTSKITGNKVKAVRLGIRMFWIIFINRFSADKISKSHEV